MLTYSNHDRNSCGMTYVYPVLSRRAEGLSLGINLNPNNACNWHCVYCQVPQLKRGTAPEISLPDLEKEIDEYLSRRLPQEKAELKDIAISGNGEPTSSPQFEAVVEIIGKKFQEFHLPASLKFRLITNGSWMKQKNVQSGIQKMKTLNGEIWFKIDSLLEETIFRVNGVRLQPNQIFENLQIACSLCSTWIQTCLFQYDGKNPSDEEQKAYENFLKKIKRENLPLQGVLLYGVARPSMQPEAVHLSAVSLEWMKKFQKTLEGTGFAIQLNQ